MSATDDKHDPSKARISSALSSEYRIFRESGILTDGYGMEALDGI